MTATCRLSEDKLRGKPRGIPKRKDELSDDEFFDPTKKSGPLRRACFDLLKEHERNGELPTNQRFLFYELVQRGLIPKKYPKEASRTPAKDVCLALTDLRRTGRVPWSWLLDEKREVSSWLYAKTVAEYVSKSVNRARIDLWGGEPPPMIICESAAVAGVLDNISREYLVPLTTVSGNCAAHIHNEIADFFSTVERRVGYVGDFEVNGPGEAIESYTRNEIEQAACCNFDDESWQRIALTQAQINRTPSLKKLVAERWDNRCKPPKAYDAYECEALGQSVIKRLVTKWLDDQLPRPLATVRGQETRQRAAVLKKLSGLRP